MVKAPSKGLAKFKPWRRGASSKTKPKGSVKHQLRGQERLLAKASGDEQRRAIQIRIDELRRQYQSRKEKEVEREHAKKSHGTRFLERQRLTRSVKKARDAGDDAALRRLALDQAYVGHYPHDKRYIKLFRNGKRVVDAHKDLVQRARVRDRILRDVAASKRQSEDDAPRVDWISAEQYDRLPSSWSVEDERRVFGERDVAAAAAEGSSDTRFLAPATSDAHSKLLQAAVDAERMAMEEQPDNELDSDGDGSGSGDSEESEGRNRAKDKAPRVREPMHGSSIADQDGDATSSDSSSSSSSSTSSSDSEDEGDSYVGKNAAKDSTMGAPMTSRTDKDEGENAAADDDDFLVDATGDETIAFAAAPLVKGLDQVRGDKSQGWATQRQRPGQYKNSRPRQNPPQYSNNPRGFGKSSRW